MNASKVIKRPDIPKYIRNELTEQSLIGTSLFPQWYIEVKNKNRFFYRFNNTLNSILQDALNEQSLMVSKFNLRDIDVTQPYFATVTTINPRLDSRLYRAVTGYDWLVSDAYYTGYRIPSDTEIIAEQTAGMQYLIENNFVKYLDEADIPNLGKQPSPGQTVFDLLESGEILLSGESDRVPTSFGRVMSFEEDNQGVYQNAARTEATLETDGIYFTIDPLFFGNSISFSDPVTESPLNIGNVTRLLVGRIEALGNYEPLYDIDKDGYVSPEDVQYVRELVGRSVNNTPEREWHNLYAKFDRNNDGIITSTDIVQLDLAIGAVAYNMGVVRNPTPGRAARIEFEYFDSPYTTYYGVDEVPGGNYGLAQELDPNLVDSRLVDGFYENENGVIVGINILLNQVSAGRKTDNGWKLRKINYPDSDFMLVRGMTQMDGVVYILLQTEDPARLFNGYANVALARVDTRREAIEGTTDIIGIRGIELEQNELLTGICTTDRKDVFRVFSSLPQIMKIKLEPAVVSESSQSSLVLASQGLEKVMAEEDKGPRRRIYNDLDNFAFNYGITRSYKFGN